jgi:hypothetical protein
VVAGCCYEDYIITRPISGKHIATISNKGYNVQQGGFGDSELIEPLFLSGEHGGFKEKWRPPLLTPRSP